MTDILPFMIANALPFRCIWYYKQTSDGKKKPIGEKNDIPEEEIISSRWSNKAIPEWAKTHARYKNVSEEEWATLTPTYSIYLKYVPKLYVVDVDVAGINSMDDFVSQTGITFFKNTVWIKGNTKGIHIYIYINNMISYTNQQGIYHDFEGDILKVNNVWEGRTKKVEGGEQIDTVEWDSIKSIFNVDKMNSDENKNTGKRVKNLLKNIVQKIKKEETTNEIISTEIPAKWREYIFTVLEHKDNQKIIRYKDWLVITTVMKTNGFTLAEWRDWDHSTDNQDDTWKGIKQTEPWDWLILAKIGKELFPEKHQAWLDKYVEKKTQKEEEEVCEGDPNNSFGKVVAKFEETHCKIINKAFFAKKTEDGTHIFMTPSHLQHSYSHMSYEELVMKENPKGPPTFEIIKKRFLPEWLGIDHDIKKYDDIGLYPNPNKCPSNILNLWTSFAGEKLVGEKHEEGLQAMRNHILILCNNDVVVADYFEKWIAQMLQYPEVKTICPTLISAEGAGKGTLLTLIQKMMGKSKVYITTTPSRDVWGNFNSMMANSFLVNLNELSLKDTVEAMSVIKGLITDDTMTINDKGIRPYEIKSYHRFIITTNNPEPITSKKGDRRNLIISSSDEMCGNIPYFTKMQEYLADEAVIKTCYDYFMSIPDMDKFGMIPMPITAYQKELKEQNKSPLEHFLESFTQENFDKPEVEILSCDLLEQLKKWGKKMNIEHLNLSGPKLGKALANLKCNNGVRKGKHTNKGNTWIMDIPALKIHFGIGNLVMWNNDETDNESEDSP